MSDSTAVGLRWNNGGSPKLPPVTSLYPDQKAEQSILEHTRDHWSSASHSSRSTVNASTCPLVEYDKNEISSNRKRNRDYVSNEQLYKRSWTDSRKYNITDAYGLNESDVDTVRIMKAIFISANTLLVFIKEHFTLDFRLYRRYQRDAWSSWNDHQLYAILFTFTHRWFRNYNTV
jgi:hypothetical protein